MPPQRLLIILACALTCATTAVAAAPTGHFQVDGEVVQDTATKLTWQRISPTKNYSNTDAAAYCASLDLRGKGWRLPTIKELHTLVDESRTLPAIDVDAFPDTQPTFFWTGSSLSKFPQYTWVVNFADGTDSWFPGDLAQRVRCVR